MREENLVGIDVEIIRSKWGFFNVSAFFFFVVVCGIVVSKLLGYLCFK